MEVVLWLGLVVLGVATMQWGASRAADLLEALKGKYALTPTAGGALLGLATAAPETAVNTASVAFGWTDLGLGAALGSNVPALPLAFGLAYLGARFASGGGQERAPGRPAVSSLSAAAAPAVVAPQAVPVQVLPYLGIVLLLGLLTLPPAWSGLQLVDGLILVAAWAAFFGRALLRRAWRDNGGPLPEGSLKRTLLFGVPAIAIGALASVIAAQKVGAIFGWSDLVVGLFVIGFLCALPEAYSAYRFGREGQSTVAISAATGDGIVSLTIALVPTALVGAAVGNVAIYLVNLGFLIVVLGLYALLNHRRRGLELGPGFVALFAGLYVGYAGLIAYVLATST